MDRLSKRGRARVIVYPLLALALMGGFRLTLPARASDDLRTILGRLGPVPDERTWVFREGLVYMGLFPGRGWTLSLHVKDDPAFAPARLVLISRVDEALQVELLVGEAQTSVLRGAEATAYLAHVGVPLAAIDAATAACWPRRSAPASVSSAAPVGTAVVAK